MYMHMHVVLGNNVTVRELLGVIGWLISLWKSQESTQDFKFGSKSFYLLGLHVCAATPGYLYFFW